MKRRGVVLRIWSIVLVCVLLLPGSAGSVQRTEGEMPAAPSFAPGEVLVKFTPALAVTAGAQGAFAAGDATLDQLFTDLGVTAVQPVFAGMTANTAGLERIFKLTLVADADVASAVAALAADANVEFAEPNYIFTVQGESDALEQAPPAGASEEELIREAVRQAISREATAAAAGGQAFDPTLTAGRVQYSGDWAYAGLTVAATEPDSPPWEISVALLHREQAGAPWQVTFAPSETWQVWLEQLPDSLIDAPTKNYLLGTLVPSAPVTHYDGYRLPWTARQTGQIWCVEGNPGCSGYHEHPAADLFISQTLTVRAAKGGTVVFRKEVSNDGCQDISCWFQANLVVLRHSNNEYSWYMHLAHNSIPDEVQEGSEVEQGAILGEQGRTGYTVGENPDHIHFMVSTVLPATTHPPAHVDDPIWQIPDWPTGNFATFDFAEIGWDRLNDTVRYTVITSTNPVNDALFGRQWGLQNLGQNSGKYDADLDATGAWTMTKGSNGVLIAVIDTGIDYGHEDLNDGRIRTDIDKDYVNDDDEAMDDHGHGTHVTGIIAAETDNKVGVAGIMWNAQILPLKAMSKDGTGTAEDVAEAIRYGADKGARVINMSLGGDSCSQTMADAVNYAYFDKGVTLVAAAGNNGGSIGYPAKYAPVIAVGATDNKDVLTSFSSHGVELDVTAPGLTIFSTVPNNGYEAWSGTSMAAPHVAGVAGLLLSQRPALNNNEVSAILTQSADDLGKDGFDTVYGYGRVNAQKALLLKTPSDVKAPDRVQCPSSACAATTALSSEPDGAGILTNLRAVRDGVFTTDPGRRWSQVYYQYQWEVAWIVASDSQVRADVTDGFRAFNPVFGALLSDNPNQVVTLTPELIAAARKALMGVAAQGGAEMSATIQQEWDKVNPDRFVGWDVRDVWEQLQQENLTPQLYLPHVAQ